MVTEYKTILFLVYLIAQQPLQLKILTRKNNYIYNAIFRFLAKSLGLLISSVFSRNFASDIFLFSLLFSCFLAILASICTLVVTSTFFGLAAAAELSNFISSSRCLNSLTSAADLGS